MAGENDNEKMIIEIELDDGKLVKGFINAKAVANDSGKEAGKSFGDGAEAAANRGLSSLKNTLLGFGSILAGAFAVREVVSAAMENEAAVNRLNGSLRLTGEYSPQASQGLQDYADKLSRLTTISGEAILDQLSFAKSLGATTSQSKQITQAAADMSAALGINFESAVSNLTRTLNGTGGTLVKLIPEIKSFTKEQLESGAALDLISQKFAGFSATKTEGFSGALAGMKNSFGELVEEVGKFVTRSPVVVATFNVLAKYLDMVTDSVSGLTNDKTGLNSVSFAAIEMGKVFVDYVIAPLELLYNVGNVVFNFLRTGLQTLVTGLASALGGMADLANKFGIDNEFTRGIQAFSEGSKEVLFDMVEQTNQAGEQMFDFPFASKVAGIVDEIEAVTKKIAGKTGEAVAQTFKTVDVISEETKKKTDKLKAILENGLTRVVASSMEMIGASLVEGAFSFESFGYQVLGIFGDLLIQLGTASITIGLGVQAIAASVATLGAGPALAAGLAMIVLGGALKAFAAKGGAATNKNSVGPQTGGESYGSQAKDAPASSTSLDAPETNATRETAVIINVQGDMLDSGDTGRRLVDIINDAYDKQGIKIRRGAVA